MIGNQCSLRSFLFSQNCDPNHAAHSYRNRAISLGKSIGCHLIGENPCRTFRSVKLCDLVFEMDGDGSLQSTDCSVWRTEVTKDQSNSSAAFGDRFDFDRSELFDALQNDVKLFETAAIDAKTGKQVLIQACVESALPVGTKFLFEHENRNLTQLQCDTLCVPIHYSVEAEVAFVAKPLESGEPLLDRENNELGLEQKLSLINI